MRNENHTVESNIKYAAYASIAVAVVVMGIKYLAYHVTGSVALYSDAIESIANILTALAALAAIRVSTSPPDNLHPFGHHKAEYFSAVFEGVLIIVAALVVLDAAWHALLNPRQFEQPALGMAINLVAGVLNAGWAWFLVSRRPRLALARPVAADGWHLVSDVVTSAGVIAGLIVATLTGWAFFDPLLAAVVAINILWTGYHIVRQSLSSLLDEAAPPDIQTKIIDAIRENGTGALEAHDVRTRQAGRTTFVEFHLVVPGGMTVEAAHAICDRLEAGVEQAVEGTRTVIHVEPEHKAKRHRTGDAIPLR